MQGFKFKRKLRNAVMRLDVELLKSLLSNYDGKDLMVYPRKEDRISDPYPVEYLTQCLELIIDEPQNWNKDVRPKIETVIADFKEIDKMLRERLGGEFHVIDFEEWKDLFYCSDPGESFEDIYLFATMDQLLAKGARKIDMELYAAVHKFEYEEVERLLKLGANPLATFEDNDDYALDRIDGEEVFLYCTYFQDYLFETPKQRTYVPELGLFIGLAAHEKMSRLLRKYTHLYTSPL